MKSFLEIGSNINQIRILAGNIFKTIENMLKDLKEWGHKK